MSEPRRRRRADRSRAVGPARPVSRRRGSRLRFAALLVGFAVLAALAWWRTQRMYERRAGQPGSGAIVPVPLDSLAAAERMFDAAARRSDWPEALRWQRRIAAALPASPLALRQLGQVLHNHRYAVTLPDGRPRRLLRNSLVRAEWGAQALRMFDSSGVVAAEPDDRARAHWWRGRVAEFEGLPLDALAEYEAALAMVPADTMLRRVRDQQRQKLLAEP